MTHRALYDYDGRSEKELTFKKDEFITVIREDESGWAEGKSGIRSGWFPISFVAPLPEPKAVGLAKVKGKKSKRMSTRFFGKDPKETKKDTRSIALSSSTTNVCLFYFLLQFLSYLYLFFRKKKMMTMMNFLFLGTKRKHLIIYPNGYQVEMQN